MQGFLAGLLSGDFLTAGVSILALVVVWVPFVRGLRVTFQAWTATRELDAREIEAGLRNGTSGDVEPLAILMARVFRSSRDASGTEGASKEFVFDASRQYVMNEFDLYYSRPITMFASLMPPIGFIGTTVGMMILFIAMHKANANLELGALAMALTSSIFALIAYAILEGIKIRLYTRLMHCLREVETLCGFTSAGAGSAKGSTHAKRPAGAPA